MMSKKGRKYQEAAAKVDRSRTYTQEEAIDLLKATVTTKFDPTVEIHARLGVDPRHADQQVRDVVVLPNGLGKTVRVLVFAEADDVQYAGSADYIADDEMIGRIQAGWMDFDVAIATPRMMGKVGRLGRVLGPRGLMPNPKAGTVVPGSELPRVIEEARAGRVEFRVDKTGNVHAPFGKAGFPKEHLMENLTTFLDALRRARPATVKGAYIRKLTVANAMGPGIRLEVV
jgi:large subunit ribosomal protein L1